jgi:hypothetical protein
LIRLQNRQKVPATLYFFSPPIQSNGRQFFLQSPQKFFVVQNTFFKLFANRLQKLNRRNDTKLKLLFVRFGNVQKVFVVGYQKIRFAGERGCQHQIIIGIAAFSRNFAERKFGNYTESFENLF